jgi:hypothetical protein
MPQHVVGTMWKQSGIAVQLNMNCSCLSLKQANKNISTANSFSDTLVQKTKHSQTQLTNTFTYTEEHTSGILHSSNA